MVDQSTHSSVANSTASKLRHGPRRMNDLGLVKTVDRFGQSVVVAVADATHGRLDTGLGEALGIASIEPLLTLVAAFIDGSGWVG